MPDPSMTPKEQKAYEVALRRIEECRRGLDLSGLDLSGLNLLGLDLSGLGLSRLPPEIGMLTELTGLSLHDNQLATLPPEIGKLTALTRLHLADNHLATLPPEIGKLTALTELWLYGNQLATLPQEIGRLVALTVLHLADNQLATLPLEIGKLTALSRLHLADNQLATLPREIGRLTALTVLHLSRNQLATLPREIGMLTALRGLYLHDNQLAALPPEIGNFTALRELDISENQLATLPSEIGRLIALTGLLLSRNKLATLPPEICQLSALESLTLHDNNLVQLPEDLGNLRKLRQLTLHGNDDLGLPSEILGPPSLDSHKDKPSANPRDILHFYFAQKQGPRRLLNEVKLLVVGESEVGKTSLIRQLRGEDHNTKQDKTHGIERHQVPLVCGGLGEVRLNIWDFGGQDIMHATHQFFLTRRSVYLLVLDSRQNERQSRIDYWLRLIASYGGESPVIVVCNKADQQVMELNWKGLERDYPQIKSFAREISCYHHDGTDRRKGLGDLKRLIAVAVEHYVPEVNKPILESWLDLKDQLEADSRPYLTLEEYHALADKAGLHDQRDREVLLTLMHQLGSVLHFSEHSIFEKDLNSNAAPVHVEEMNVLDPGWVTGAIYKLLNDAELIRAGGIMTRGDMRRSLAELPDGAARYPRAKEDFILTMMRRFEICFPFDGETDRWFLPDLLHKDEVDTGDWSHALRFRYQYRVLPGSVMGRVIVRLHTHLARHCLWRTGAKLKQGDCEALVRSEPEDERLDIFIRGGTERQRREFLALIRGTLEDIHRSFSENLGTRELVPVPGHAEVFVGYSKLLLLEEQRTLVCPEEVDGKLIEINVADALNGPTERGTRDRDRRRLSARHESTKDLTRLRSASSETGVHSPLKAWWKSWPMISVGTALGVGILALVLLKWENTTGRIIIGVIAAVFALMMTHDPKLRFRRWFQWALFGWMATNAAGIALTTKLKDQNGEAMVKWDGTVGWSFNITFMVVVGVTGFLAFREWRNESS